MKTNIQTLKGFRDFLGVEAKRRSWMISMIREVFERYGLEPLETPTLEYEELLLGKYGDEAEKLVYRFEDNGGRRVAMRYDQTVPMARVIAQYQQQLTHPYKRYQIQPVWRADKPQKGRYREFYQCDADIIGSDSSLADAEILSLFYAIYAKLGVTSIQLKLNDRAQLLDTIRAQGVAESMVLSVVQTIDKLDKQSVSAVVAELVQKGVESDVAEDVLGALQESKPSDKLQLIMAAATDLGVPVSALVYDPTLARGLDYYTGLIFEGIIPEYPVGSVGGGGRYDNLIKELSGIDAPAVGFAVGFDRTYEALETLGLFPEFQIGARVVICYFDETRRDALQLATKLRSAGISVSIYMGESLKMDKQLKYADRLGAQYAVILGEDEMQKGAVLLKDLKKRGQREVLLADIVSEFDNLSF